MRVPVSVPEFKIGASSHQRCHPAKEKDMVKIDLPKERGRDWKEVMLKKMAEVLDRYRSVRLFHGYLREMRRLCGQVPVLPWDRRSEEYARGQGGPFQESLQALFHPGWKDLGKGQRGGGAGRKGPRRNGSPTSISAASAGAARSSALTGSIRRRSPWRPGRSWPPQALPPNM